MVKQHSQHPRRILSYLPLLLGLAIFILMTAIVDELSEEIGDREPLNAVDIRLSNYLHVRGSSAITTAMHAVTSFGSTLVAVSVAVVFGLFLLWKRRVAWLLTLIASVLGGALLNRLLKYLFHRPRPFFDDPILTLTSYSFPSGHTMLATVLYGVIAAYFVTNVRSWQQRASIVFSAGLLILLVGFSRIYLGAHYLSDVLAAFAEGFAWLSLCLTVLFSVSDVTHQQAVSNR